MIVPDPPRRVLLEDEILSETRQRKQAYAAEHDYDIDSIARDANARARNAGIELEHRVVHTDPEASHP